MPNRQKAGFVTFIACGGFAKCGRISYVADVGSLSKVTVKLTTEMNWG
jgi:hypothetical protein